jgi:hypothetical protein
MRVRARAVFAESLRNAHRWLDDLVMDPNQTIELIAAREGKSERALVHEVLEACDEKRLLRLQRQVAGYKLLIIDELGYVPLSQTGAEPLFEIFSQRYERGSSGLPVS